MERVRYICLLLYHKDEPNVGKYTILGWYGIDFLFGSARSYQNKAVPFVFLWMLSSWLRGRAFWEREGGGDCVFSGREGPIKKMVVSYSTSAYPPRQGIVVQNGASKRWTPEISPLLWVQNDYDNICAPLLVPRICKFCGIILLGVR